MILIGMAFTLKLPILLHVSELSVSMTRSPIYREEDISQSTIRLSLIMFPKCLILKCFRPPALFKNSHLSVSI